MSQDPRQNHPCSWKQSKKITVENMEDLRPTTPDNTVSKLASIKNLLHRITADESSMKTGLEKLQTTVEQLGARVTEAETRISDLEDASNS